MAVRAVESLDYLNHPRHHQSVIHQSVILQPLFNRWILEPARRQRRRPRRSRHLSPEKKRERKKKNDSNDNTQRYVQYIARLRVLMHSADADHWQLAAQMSAESKAPTTIAAAAALTATNTAAAAAGSDSTTDGAASAK